MDENIDHGADQLVKREPETIQVCEGKRSGGKLVAQYAGVSDVHVGVAESIREQEGSQNSGNS